MTKYPKIQTVYDRDKETFKVTPWLVRRAEYTLVKEWYFFEKVDGMNIRVMVLPDGNITFGGRTDRAQLPSELVNHLTGAFTQDLVHSAFTPNEDGTWPEITLYGEGYGPKIQKGGKYRDDQAFCLFDIKIGRWWLNWESVMDIATQLQVKTAPMIGIYTDIPKSYSELESLFPWGSYVARQNDKTCLEPEGIVARTEPLLFDRRGNRVMWKLKFSDF